jgi:hypothetical protein
MGSRRFVNHLLSVFDMDTDEVLNFPGRASVRVLFEYDMKAGLRRFAILTPGLASDAVSKLMAWLEENIRAEDIAYELESNRLVPHAFMRHTSNA